MNRIEFTVGPLCDRPRCLRSRSWAVIERLYRNPTIFNTRKSSFVERSGPLRLTSQCAYPLVARDQRNKRTNRQQDPPSGDEMEFSRQPKNRDKDEPCDQTEFSN